jgi:hypothetical protein
MTSREKKILRLAAENLAKRAGNVRESLRSSPGPSDHRSEACGKAFAYQVAADYLNSLADGIEKLPVAMKDLKDHPTE